MNKQLVKQLQTVKDGGYIQTATQKKFVAAGFAEVKFNEFGYGKLILTELGKVELDLAKGDWIPVK